MLKNRVIILKDKTGNNLVVYPEAIETANTSPDIILLTYEEAVTRIKELKVSFPDANYVICKVNLKGV